MDKACATGSGLIGAGTNYKIPSYLTIKEVKNGFTIISNQKDTYIENTHVAINKDDLITVVKEFLDTL